MTRRAALLGALAMLAGLTASVSAAQPAPTCTSPAPGQSIFITERCVDPRFNDGYAFIAVDEVRDAPVPHRFVYGGFRGTDARFAFSFPPADQYQGRFFEGPVHQLRLLGEAASPNEMRFAFDSGAYLVETNNGGYENCLSARDNVKQRCDPTVRGYRVAAAAAKFSREVAKRVYGTTKRPFGYLYGGSGGAYQSLSSAERTRGVWDGFVPFVMGDPYALVAHFELRAHAARVLGDRFKQVVDAMDAGGSGKPYATLTRDQAAALRESTRFGFPLRAWWQYSSYTGGPNFLTGDYINLVDPTYTQDFWSKPGYLGTARTPEGQALRAARVSKEVTVVSATPYVPSPASVPSTPLDALGPAYPYYSVATIGQTIPPKAVTVDALPEGDLRGALIDVLTGPGRGKYCPLSVIDASLRLIQCGGGSDQGTVNAIGPGDRLRISTSWALAYETQARHDLPPAAWRVKTYDQFRHRDGSPTFPQRTRSPGMVGAPDGSGSIATGAFFGKMIVMNTLLDQDAFPYPAEWYRTQAAKHGRTSDLRVWFADNAVHGGVPDATRTVDYMGVLEQALRDLAAWVEKGTPPPAMHYTVDADNQVHLPRTAAARGGVQPVVELSVAGRSRADVKAGTAVVLRGSITAPPGTGKVVCVEWDAEGTGSFVTPRDALPAAAQADPGGAYQNVASVPNPNCEAAGAQERVELVHTYTEPGTYFAVLRGTTQRSGDPRTSFGRAQNLARVRVVVH